MKKEKKWKIAIIGVGAFSQWVYLPDIPKCANAECTAVCDIKQDRLDFARDQYGVKECYLNVEDLLAESDFDIAIDATPIHVHHRINMAVLSAKKHLISQKPAATTVEDITAQIELAEKNHVKFSCVPIHKIAPDMRMARQLIDSGAIGELLSAKCVSAHGGPEYFQYRDSDPSWFYEPGSGALFDMGVHALHKITSIMGPAKRVSCLAATGIPRRVIRSGICNGKEICSDKLPDTYYISLDFGGGKVGFVDTGFTQIASKCPPFEIYGTNGVISFKHSRENPSLYTDVPEKGFRGWTELDDWLVQRPLSFSQCCCLTDMVNAIENDTAPLLSPLQARHVIEIMNRIPDCIQTGSTLNLTTTF